jgi:hypothetical protein
VLSKKHKSKLELGNRLEFFDISTVGKALIYMRCGTIEA